MLYTAEHKSNPSRSVNETHLGEQHDRTQQSQEECCSRTIANGKASLYATNQYNATTHYGRVFHDWLSILHHEAKVGMVLGKRHGLTTDTAADIDHERILFQTTPIKA